MVILVQNKLTDYFVLKKCMNAFYIESIHCCFLKNEVPGRFVWNEEIQ